MNEHLKKLIRTHYLSLSGYVSAGMEAAKGDEKIFMNANENPYALPGLGSMNRYPEPQPIELLEAYAKTYGVEPSQILATRGADESIKLLTRVFCEPHKDSILIHPPTFGIYKVDAQSLPVEVLEVPLIEEAGSFALDTEKMIETAKSKKTKIVYICSPNNPTGSSFAHEDILNICTELEGTSVVILDEAYVEFSAKESLTPKLAEHSNLIILRTLSKAYSLAGARMGVTLCADKNFITFMKEKVADIYPLPLPSVMAALRALSPESKDNFQNNIQSIRSERERLKEEFRTSRLIKKTYISDANFLLVKMAIDQGDKSIAGDFIAFCLSQDLILRDLSDKPDTQGCIRITIGSPEQNDYLIKVMKRFEDKMAAAAA